jgi:hypothetical protein
MPIKVINIEKEAKEVPGKRRLGSPINGGNHGDNKKHGGNAHAAGATPTRLRRIGGGEGGGAGGPVRQHYAYLVPSAQCGTKVTDTVYFVRGSRTLDDCDLWLQEEKSLVRWFGQFGIFKNRKMQIFVYTYTKIEGR